MKIAAGELHYYTINKKLTAGLKDKRFEDYSTVNQNENQKSLIESDCSICFSTDSSHNNPIIYCSDEKYPRFTRDASLATIKCAVS